jgi:hypothetical protein
MNKKQQTHNPSRRNFLKKTAYVTPVILTLPATPALAKTGSCCTPPGLVGNTNASATGIANASANANATKP